VAKVTFDTAGTAERGAYVREVPFGNVLGGTVLGECPQETRSLPIIAQMGGQGGNKLRLAGAWLRRALRQYFRYRPHVDREELCSACDVLGRQRGSTACRGTVNFGVRS
jgi:hypothetical protein